MSSTIYNLQFTVNRFFDDKKKLIVNCQQLTVTPKGFTLIELLIVIALIGILSSLASFNFVIARQKARDTQRKAEILAIQAALEFYRSDQSSYPPNATFNICGSAAPLQGGTPATKYMREIPCDPSGPSYYNRGRYYYLLSGSNYTLRACLENANDKDGLRLVVAGCSSGKVYQVTNQ